MGHSLSKHSDQYIYFVADLYSVISNGVVPSHKDSIPKSR